MPGTRTRLAAGLLVATFALGVAAAGCSLFERDTSTRRGGGRRSARVEINTASRRQLARLPGLTANDADKIIAGRPYKRRRDLVSDGVLTRQQFDAVRDRVYVDRAADDD